MPKTHLKTPLLRHSGNQASPEHPESPTAIRDAGQVTFMKLNVTSQHDGEKGTLKHALLEYLCNNYYQYQNRDLVDDAPGFVKIVIKGFLKFVRPHKEGKSDTQEIIREHKPIKTLGGKDNK